MIRNTINKFIIKEYKLKYLIFSVISGILLALSFQNFNIHILAWIALIPLIFCIYKNNLKRAVLYSLITGFTFNVIYLYWMFPFLLQYAGKIIDTCFISLLTWLYFSSYIAVWTVVLYFSKNKVNNKNI